MFLAILSLFGLERINNMSYPYSMTGKETGISVYPTTQLINQQISVDEYVNRCAQDMADTYLIDYRFDTENFKKLCFLAIKYAEEKKLR